MFLNNDIEKLKNNQYYILKKIFYEQKLIKYRIYNKILNILIILSSYLISKSMMEYILLKIKNNIVFFFLRVLYFF
jgi:hypothetical protein